MEVQPGKRPLVDNEQQSHVLGVRNQEQIHEPEAGLSCLPARALQWRAG